MPEQNESFVRAVHSKRARRVNQQGANGVPQVSLWNSPLQKREFFLLVFKMCPFNYHIFKVFNTTPQN